MIVSESAVECCRCVHTEKLATRSRDGQLVYNECELEAIDRLDAVSNGSVVLSMEEGLSQRGHHTALYRSKLDGSNEDGNMEECVSAILVPNILLLRQCAF